MIRKKRIAPSILSADFAHLADEISAVRDAGADLLHIDIMDGHFVPNISIGPLIVEAIKRNTDLPLDVHLMIDNPDSYLEQFINAGSTYLTVHVEACRHLHRTIQFIKDKGIKAGVSLNPSTPLSSIEDIIYDIDLLLLMSVNPGFGGQSFIKGIIKKVEKAREMIDKSGVNVELEVDGGIKVDNIRSVSTAGADMFVAGSAVFGSKDYKETINKLRLEMTI